MRFLVSICATVNGVSGERRPAAPQHTDGWDIETPTIVVELGADWRSMKAKSRICISSWRLLASRRTIRHFESRRPDSTSRITVT
jgi:hypothetical protein